MLLSSHRPFSNVVIGTKRPAHDSVVEDLENSPRSGISPSSSALIAQLIQEVDIQYDTVVEDEEVRSAKKSKLGPFDPLEADGVYAPMPSTSLFPNLNRKAPTEDGFPGQFVALTSPIKLMQG